MSDEPATNESLDKRLKSLEAVLEKYLDCQSSATMQAVETLERTTVKSILDNQEFKNSVTKVVHENTIGLAKGLWKNWKSYAVLGFTFAAAVGLSWVSVNRWVANQLDDTFKKQVDPLVANARLSLKATEDSIRTEFANSLSNAAIGR